MTFAAGMVPRVLKTFVQMDPLTVLASATERMFTTTVAFVTETVRRVNFVKTESLIAKEPAMVVSPRMNVAFAVVTVKRVLHSVSMESLTAMVNATALALWTNAMSAMVMVRVVSVTVAVWTARALAMDSFHTMNAGCVEASVAPARSPFAKMAKLIVTVNVTEVVWMTNVTFVVVMG